MRIQDMRSGISHLSKKMTGEEREDIFGAAEVAEQDVESHQPISSELDEPRWSVVSFDKHEAGGLTYHQAAELMALLNAHRIHGLCVITDAAAKRYGT